MLPPNDPQERFRAELPKIEKERTPAGYHAGWQLGDRLQGLAVVGLGLVGLLVVYGIFSGALPAGLPPPPPPPGVLVQVPVLNATACFLPLIAISSIGLIIVGFRRFIDP